MMLTARFVGLSVLLFAVVAHRVYAQSPLPDPKLTPGAVNPDVTQQTIETTICVRGWTRLVRAPGRRGTAGHGTL